MARNMQLASFLLASMILGRNSALSLFDISLLYCTSTTILTLTSDITVTSTATVTSVCKSVIKLDSKIYITDSGLGY